MATDGYGPCHRPSLPTRAKGEAGSVPERAQQNLPLPEVLLFCDDASISKIFQGIQPRLYVGRLDRSFALLSTLATEIARRREFID